MCLTDFGLCPGSRSSAVLSPAGTVCTNSLGCTPEYGTGREMSEPSARPPKYAIYFLDSRVTWLMSDLPDRRRLRSTRARISLESLTAT